VIESTGLADPFPILSTLHADPVLRHHFQLGHVVTTVDAANGDLQLDEYEQSVRQAAIADRIVLTKTGLASPGATHALVERLRALNPLAPIVNAEHDDIDAEVLLCTDLLDMSRKTLAARQWLAAERQPPGWLPRGDPASADGAEDSADDGEDDVELPPRDGRYLGQQRRSGPAESRHDANIRAFSVELALPVDWTLFGIWLTMLVHRHGANILRIKGILDVQGSATPVAIHGVQHLIHPPVHMAAWPDSDRHSRLVFIVKGLDRATVQRSLNAFIGAAAPAS
jgi:G3E family GTPase